MTFIDQKRLHSLLLHLVAMYFFPSDNRPSHQLPVCVREAPKLVLRTCDSACLEERVQLGTQTRAAGRGALAAPPAFGAMRVLVHLAVSDMMSGMPRPVSFRWRERDAAHPPQDASFSQLGRRIAGMSFHMLNLLA